MKVTYIISILLSFLFKGYSQEDTLIIKESILKTFISQNARFTYENKDTTFYLGYKKYKENDELVSMIRKYQIALNRLTPISSINDSGIIVETFYSGGEEKIGPYKLYYDNGILKEEGDYSREKYKWKEGVWKYYSPDGTMKKKVTYEKGKKKSSIHYK